MKLFADQEAQKTLSFIIFFSKICQLLKAAARADL
jgi:hypothetical protein